MYYWSLLTCWLMLSATEHQSYAQALCHTISFFLVAASEYSHSFVHLVWPGHSKYLFHQWNKWCKRHWTNILVTALNDWALQGSSLHSDPDHGNFCIKTFYKRKERCDLYQFTTYSLVNLSGCGKITDKSTVSSVSFSGHGVLQYWVCRLKSFIIHQHLAKLWVGIYRLPFCLTVIIQMHTYQGHFINKLHTSIILLIFKIWKTWNTCIHFVDNLLLNTSNRFHYVTSLINMLLNASHKVQRSVNCFLWSQGLSANDIHS